MREYRCQKCNHRIHYENGRWHHFQKQEHWAVPPTTKCWNWKWTYRNWFIFGILTLLLQIVLQNLQKLNNSFLPQIPLGSILIFALGILILKHMYGIVMWWIEYFDRYPATNLIIDVCGYLIILSVILSIPMEHSIQVPDASIVNSNKISIDTNDSNVKYASASPTPDTTTNPVKTASVSLYGEKTDVVMGEDILLKLSAVNLITKPKMHVQVIIIPPSGMSVTSSEFSKIAAGQFTANYELPPGDGRDIEVSIRSNQVGDFNVNGRIIYYFGDEKEKAEDHTLTLPIKVRKEAAPRQGQTQAPNSNPSIAGFEAIMSITGILLVSLLKKKW